MWDSARRSFRTLVTVILPTVLLSLGILEIGLRAVGRQPSNTTDGIFVQHGDSYRLKKNIAKLTKTPVYSCLVYTNSLGFRDQAPGDRRLGSRPYYAFLGESLTFGNGLDYEQSFAGAFAKRAEKRGVDVINLATGGHYLYDQEQVFRDFLAQVSRRPEKVIVCFSPLLIANFDQKYTDIIVKNGYIFEKRGWLVPYLRLTLGNASAAYCFFRDNVRKIQARVSNYERKFARTQLDFFAKDNRMTRPDAAAGLEAVLTGLDDDIRGAGAVPVYVYLPASTDFSVDALVRQTGEDPERYDLSLYFRLLQKHCEAHGIPLINLIPALKAHFDRGELLNFIQDPHYNAAANRIIVDEIYPAIMSRDQPRDR